MKKKPIKVVHTYTGKYSSEWYLEGEPGFEFLIQIGNDDFRVRKLSNVNGTKKLTKKHAPGAKPTVIQLRYLDDQE